LDAAEIAKEEADLRAFTVTLIASFIRKEEMGYEDKNHMVEARYYLEVNNYDMEKAKANYLADVEYEKNEKNKYKAAAKTFKAK
jgi:hypothetical protein